MDYQDRLGAIASMETQLEKSITSLIIYGEHAKSDYEFIRNHLAKIMMNGAYEDKKREPEHIAIYHLSWLVARMVIDFSIDPELEGNFTTQGRVTPPFLIELMGRKSKSLLLFKNRWTTIY